MRPKLREPIAVLGYGLEGKSTLRYLQNRGYREITVLDRVVPSEPLPADIHGRFGEDYLQGLQGIHTAIRSPGLRPLVSEIEAFKKQGGALTSQVEIALESLDRRRIIGVTGTLGKGTCCSLLSAMLIRGGVSHRLAGNIGLPPLDVVEDLKPDEWLLLELSSFQLSTLNQSPGVAVILRTTSEHLDWHASQAEYWDHKANLARHQGPKDLCVYFADTEGSAWIGSLGQGRKISFGQTGDMRLSEQGIEWPERGFQLHLDETQLLGAFNLENLASAATVALDLGVSAENVCNAAKDFAPLEHRLEFVRNVDGISYYNDSYATRPEAALAAVRALRGKPLGLILGGSEKFADFTELAQGLASESHLSAIALIGHTAHRLETELRVAGAFNQSKYRICNSLEEALEFLRSEISSGSILLSPACASFGLFANYKERGYAFKRCVDSLPSDSRPGK